MFFKNLRKARKLFETKLRSRNHIKGINTLAVPLVRLSGPLLKRTREEIQQMDKRTRKLMMMHRAFHPRDDTDRLFISRKGERTFKIALIHRHTDSKIA